MNLPVLRKNQMNKLSRLFDGDLDFGLDLFHRSVFDEFDRFFGTNLHTTDNGDVIYQIEVPGFNKDNLEVTLADGILTIKGDRKVKDKNYAGQSSIHKRCTVGSGVESAEAKITDGILTVTLKYPQPEEPKKIEVE